MRVGCIESHQDGCGGESWGIRVLVVEDDFLIAMDTSRTLAEAGFEVVGPARSVAVSLKLIANCDVAVLNFMLGNETSEPIARKLQAVGKPFVVLSGYPADKLPPLLAGATILTKPCPADEFVAAVREAARSQSNLTDRSL
jgi:DNA-binding response OmpR family regulator